METEIMKKNINKQNQHERLKLTKVDILAF